MSCSIAFFPLEICDSLTCYSRRFVQDEEERIQKTIEQIETVRKQIKQLKLDIEISLFQKEKPR